MADWDYSSLEVTDDLLLVSNMNDIYISDKDGSDVSQMHINSRITSDVADLLVLAEMKSPIINRAER